jgi:hypothetical protein
VQAQVRRLEGDLAQAMQRAERAERWLVVIRREIEGHLDSLTRSGRSAGTTSGATKSGSGRPTVVRLD